MQDDNLKNPLDAGGAIGGTEREVAETRFTPEQIFQARIYELRKWIETIERAFPAARMFTQQALLSDDKFHPAAAPGLYEVLEEGWLLLRNGTKDAATGISIDILPWLDNVRAALAKARGERL